MIEVFKQRLREEMELNHLTTAALAKQIDVSPEMVTQYCTTKKLPSLDTFLKICKALEVSADYLLGLEN